MLTEEKRARDEAFWRQKRDWIGAERKKGRWFTARYAISRAIICPIVGHKLFPLTLSDGYVVFEMFGPGRWICRRCMWQGVSKRWAKLFHGYDTLDPETMKWVRTSERNKRGADSDRACS